MSAIESHVCMLAMQEQR